MILKWENHSEFATYTLYTYAPLPEHLGRDSFATDLHDYFTNRMAWKLSPVGSSRPSRPASSKCRIGPSLKSRSPVWLIAGSAQLQALPQLMSADGDAAIAADFDLDHRGQVRLVVLSCIEVSTSRLGRVIQRFLEVGDLPAPMSMLTLPAARNVLSNIKDLNIQLSETVGRIGDEKESDKVVLDELLAISADLSLLSTSSSSRFNAGRAL